MNLKNIQNALSAPLSDDIKERLILIEISKDKNAIPKILEMLDNEREETSELVDDLNLEVSRLDMMFKEPKLGGNTKLERNNFRESNVNNLYQKWSHRIGHLFKK